MDQKQLLQPLKGFRDFLPEEAKKRQFVLDIIKNSFELYGFEPLETPSLEYKEFLTGKYGEEGNKLMYSFTDQGGREVALRYDQTVPTARVLAMYQQKLPIPFRRYQIQPAWRAENPQSGRYREFLQCDADIYGSYSPLADAEVIALANTIYKNLGFSDFKIYINDRTILFELMNFAGIPQNLHLATISTIDKLDRKPSEEVSDELKNLGLDEKAIDHLYHHLQEAQPTQILKEVLKNAKSLGVDEKSLIFQARLARGLDYYTGTIFEIKIESYKGGSVLGGGRYDSLISQLSGSDIPATGFAIGFDRTLEAMEQENLLPKGKRSGCLVTIFRKDLVDVSLAVTQNLRVNKIATELYPDATTNLKKQLKFADKKGLKYLVVIGPDEMKNDSVILKDLETGHQEEVKLKNLPEKILKNE